MARRPRIEIQDGIYHVYARGNRRAQIFIDEEDYESYVDDLRNLSRAMGVRVLGFCLMPNHPHKALQFTGASLSKFMQRLNTRFAKRFNRKYGVTGRLFESRYRAQLVDSPEYLLRLVRYIHLNPVRAGLVRSADQWPYSSHLAYLKRSFSFVRTREVRRALGGDERYLTWMQAEHDVEADRRLFAEARRHLAFGAREQELEDDADQGQVALNLSGGGRLVSGPWSRNKPQIPLSRAVRETVADCGATLYELASPQTCEPIRTARRHFALSLYLRGYRYSEIASVLNRDPVGVARLIERGQRFEHLAAQSLAAARAAG